MTRTDLNRQLTEHFSLDEMCRSGMAIRLGIANVPDGETVGRLLLLCRNVLEPLRRRFGVIRITSGYRCPRLNAAVGGVPGSQHLRGEAADIHVSSMEVGRKMYGFIRTHLPYDQLLFEHRRSDGARWLHVSYRGEKGLNRRMAVGNFCPDPNPYPGRGE